MSLVKMKEAGPIKVRSGVSDLSAARTPSHYGAVHMFTVPGPSEIKFSDLYPTPKAMTEEEMFAVEDAFIKAVDRCKEVGCKLFSSTRISICLNGV